MTGTWNYSGKLVLVTGSTKGIGRVIAEQYYISGARTVIHGRKQNDIDNVIKEIKNKYDNKSLNDDNLIKDVNTSEENKTNDNRNVGELYGFPADLGDLKSVEKLAEYIDKLGHLDVLINNAGIFFVKEFVDLTDEDWLKLFNINVMSSVRLSRIYLPKMLKNKKRGGNIIFISSEAGLRGLPQMLHYTSTKATQLNIARGLAQLTKGQNHVRVNSILPGPTWTEGVKEYMKGIAKRENCSLDEAVSNYFKTYEPTSLKQKFLQPKEIADTCLFLSSDLATGINGTSQKVEGGIIYTIS